ncbi:DUF423 domain-containing protein [Aliicoccus persicus]|uniref:Uncharacterized membrane protein YgdD, TMEM256/DUF423 family n=1 Tax=Aliicoccus persicus TaxID=930138 RepID=A0A662Z659_9STAP|nr:DUF423 domain-containing protein [Aliicoccus persicus]SEW07163.1 Uncharacterized membrane protein YgdD, TMEM256/DUF423 family [Aliicoccus persicus]
MRQWIIIAAVSGFLAVALGAFGAHLLEDRISEHYLGVWETAVQYQMFHTGGLLAIGVLLNFVPSKHLVRAGWLMTAGIVFFSGSLYILALSGIGILGAITPIGGILFLAAWVFIILALLGQSKNKGRVA